MSMEGKVNVKYPVGEQSFERLREGGYLYVDKTRFIERIINRGKYYFLGRPRRFGKSLFLSTLSCFFQAKRHLFKGLYADTMDWDWQPYPVLYLDINLSQYNDPVSLRNLLSDTFARWENEVCLTRRSRSDFSTSSCRITPTSTARQALAYNRGKRLCPSICYRQPRGHKDRRLFLHHAPPHNRLAPLIRAGCPYFRDKREL